MGGYNASLGIRRGRMKKWRAVVYYYSSCGYNNNAAPLAVVLIRVQPWNWKMNSYYQWLTSLRLVTFP